MRIIVEIIGYIATVGTLGAYFGLERGKIKSNGVAYPFLNIISAGLILVVGIYYRSISIITLNIFWLLISISLLRKNLRNKKWIFVKKLKG